MSKCHFCESTEKLYKYKNMYPDYPEKDIYICDACLEKLKAAKKTTTRKDSLELAYDKIAYIKHWYKPFSYLAQFFDETDICNVILKQAFVLSDDGILTDKYLTKKITIPQNIITDYLESSHFEYLGISYQSIQDNEQVKYDHDDHTAKRYNVYRTYHDYQLIIDSSVVRTLLYQKHPELKEYDFDAPPIRNQETYAVYPDIELIVPFKALMNSDTEAIKKYNMEHARSCNIHPFTPERIKKVLNSQDVQYFFGLVESLKQDKHEKPNETQKRLNTKISYLYRDESNYKSYQSVILNGLITKDQIAKILQSLPDCTYFIPEYVNFPSERNWDFNPQVDDAFWEMDKNSFSKTTEEPTIECTPDDIVKRFCDLESEWVRLGNNYPNIIDI